MSQQVLSILERHACSTQAPAKSMFQVVYANLRQPGSFSGALPTGIVDLLLTLTAIGEYVLRMLLSLPFALRYLLATRPEVVTQVLGIVN
jgi:hypothetical protein